MRTLCKILYLLYPGYRLIDTAYSYGNHRDIGVVIGRLEREDKITRKDLFITTKVPSMYLNPKDVNLCVEESLESLKSLYIDLLLIHHPWSVNNFGDGSRPLDEDGNYFYANQDLVETWKAFEEQVWSGRVKSIGISNFTPRQMLRILKHGKIRPQNAQFECHAYLQQKKLREFCRNHGVACTSYSSLGSAGRPSQHKAGENIPVLLDNEIVGEIANKYKRTKAQILLRFLLQQGLAVVPKSTSVSRLEENISVFDFMLEDKDMEILRRLDRGVRYFQFVPYRNHPEFSKNGEPF